MAGRQKVNLAAEIDEKDLPPILRKLIGDINLDRKKLMRDKAFADPAQLRAFIGLSLQERMIEFVKIFGQALFDTYQLTVSTASQQEKFQRYVTHELDLDGDGEPPGVGPEVLDGLQEAMYALGSLLQKKLPEDQETSDAYNAVVAAMTAAVDELLGESDDREDDREDDADADREEPDEEEKTPVDAPEPDAASEPAAPEAD